MKTPRSAKLSDSKYTVVIVDINSRHMTLNILSPLRDNIGTMILDLLPACGLLNAHFLGCVIGKNDLAASPLLQNLMAPFGSGQPTEYDGKLISEPVKNLLAKQGFCPDCSRSHSLVKLKKKKGFDQCPRCDRKFYPSTQQKP